MLLGSLVSWCYSDILLLDIYLKEYKAWLRNTCMSMFIVAVVTISKIWNQPRSPPINEQIRKMEYMYTGKFYTGIVKKDIMWLTRKYMQLEIIILSKGSKMKRYKHYMLPLICEL